jgi:hypothetical protein
MESNCRVRRQSIARRTNGRFGRAARQRQRPSDSQYRYGFRPTVSLRISLAMQHGGGFPFHPHLNVPLYANDGRNAAFERGTAGLPMSALGQKRTFSEVCAMSALPPIADIRGNPPDVRYVPKADIGIGSNPSQKSGGCMRTMGRL